MLSKILNFFKPKKIEKQQSKLSLTEIKALEKKTKDEIEKVGRKIGIELDKRLTKVNMLKQLKKMNNKK